MAMEADLGTLSDTQLSELNQKLIDETDSGRPLVANDLTPLAELREEYTGAPIFQKQLEWLQNEGYQSVRRIKGDGDCFYRSVAYSYVDRLLHAQDPEMVVATIFSDLDQNLEKLKMAGFDPIAYEEFHEMFTSLLRNVVQPNQEGTLLNPERLREAFCDMMFSNSTVFLFRLFASADIRLDPDRYMGFLLHPETGEPMQTKDFCESFVEVCGKEADHVQMIAVTRALKINIRVAYVDGHGSGSPVSFVELTEAVDLKAPPIVLLYRPGHYDILTEPVLAKK